MELKEVKALTYIQQALGHGIMRTARSGRNRLECRKAGHKFAIYYYPEEQYPDRENRYIIYPSGIPAEEFIYNQFKERVLKFSTPYKVIRWFQDLNIELDDWFKRAIMDANNQNSD